MKKRTFLKSAMIKKWLYPFLILTFSMGCNKQNETEPVKTMNDFGIRASNLFWYYKDLDRATRFYSDTLGLELVADYGMATILRVAANSYLILVDATKGMHTAQEPKTVAIALLTDQLDEWYSYLKEKGVKMRSDYKPVTGKPPARVKIISQGNKCLLVPLSFVEDSKYFRTTT